jgi:hypothetical protein
MQMKIESLLLTMSPPVMLFLSDEKLPDKPIRIGLRESYRPSYPPVHSCADLLVNSQHGVLVGLSYLVGEPEQAETQKIVACMPREIVYYRVLSAEGENTPYKGHETDVDALEITWTDLRPDCIEAAQLDSGCWYYFKKREVMAFGLTDIGELLEDYKLALPSIFSFPFFKPEFIEL